jgi:YcaO-like protein with predicted kinase domain
LIAAGPTDAPALPAPDATTTDLWRTLCAEDSPRSYRFGTHRAVPPSVTLRRIQRLLAGAGITRLADVTGLDWIGIPVYQAIRPNSRSLSVSQGKGLTPAQAKVSALMESLELFHAEELRLPTVRATVGTLRRQLAYDPYQLPRTVPSFLHDNMPLDWIPATDLSSGTPTWVPKRLCLLDGTLDERRRRVPTFQATSNGLASGNASGEALIHGLCEVIERDSLARLSPRLPPEQMVDLATVPSRLARGLLERFERAGIRAYVADATGPTGLPCFQVWLDHPDAATFHVGAGCHPSRLTALVRALTEAAQSRLTAIAGSRDDIVRDHYRRSARPAHPEDTLAFPSEAHQSFRRITSLPPLDTLAAVRDLTRRIRRVTGMAPLAVDLRRPEMGLPVVFVVAPGLRMPRHEA